MNLSDVTDMDSISFRDVLNLVEIIRDEIRELVKKAVDDD